MKKRAEHDFGPDHELNADPMTWRRGEGLGVNLVRASGDPKAFRKNLDSKIKEIQKRKKSK